MKHEEIEFNMTFGWHVWGIWGMSGMCGISRHTPCIRYLSLVGPTPQGSIAHLLAFMTQLLHARRGARPTRQCVSVLSARRSSTCASFDPGVSTDFSSGAGSHCQATMSADFAMYRISLDGNKVSGVKGKPVRQGKQWNGKF